MEEGRRSVGSVFEQGKGRLCPGFQGSVSVRKGSVSRIVTAASIAKGFFLGNGGW